MAEVLLTDAEKTVSRATIARAVALERVAQERKGYRATYDDWKTTDDTPEDEPNDCPDCGHDAGDCDCPCCVDE